MNNSEYPPQSRKGRKGRKIVNSPHALCFVSGIGINERIVLIGLEGLLAASLTAGDEPRVRNRWPAMALGLEGALDQFRSARHQAVVEFGDEPPYFGG